MSDYERHQAQLREIHERWREVPQMRVAQGIEDALNDWPLGSFGEDDQLIGADKDRELWLCTDHVRCSEFTLTCAEVARVLAKSPEDIRALYTIIKELRAELDSKAGEVGSG